MSAAPDLPAAGTLPMLSSQMIDVYLTDCRSTDCSEEILNQTDRNN